MKTKSINIIFYCFMIAFTSSCASIKIPNDFNSIIHENNIHELEGTYKNLSTENNIAFWKRFANVDIIKNRGIIKDTSSVFKLEIASRNELKFELYVNGELKFTEIRKFSYYEEGVGIEGKSNYRYEGVPLIFYRYESQALWLSKDNEDELFLSFNGSASGGILIFIFGTGIIGEERFEKITNSKHKSTTENK